MDNTAKIAVAIVFLVLLVGVLLLTGLLGGKPGLMVSVDNPVGTGYTYITVEVTGELEELSVKVGEEQATLVSTDGNKHIYSYFISPYSARDPLGVRTVEAAGIDADGRAVKATAELNTSYFAIGDNFIGVTHYYLASQPTEQNPSIEYPTPSDVIKSISLGTGRVNFLFEMDAGETSRNTEIINAFQSLIIELASSGVNVSSYAVDVRDGEWVKCTDTSSEPVPLAECRSMAERGPSIVLRLPDYPTSQVYLHEETVELQPAGGQVKLVVDSTIASLTSEPWIIQTDG